jgi:uncharacterized iron-regulated protein
VNTQRTLVGLAVLVTALPVGGQEVTAAAADTAYTAGDYRVFTGAGDPATLDDVVAAMASHDVVFIGETHDDPTGHALEAELLRRAWTTYGDSATGGDAARTVGVSLEFFEHDVQPIVDEYLAGLISESSFTSDTRPWERYDTDYRPVVELAKEHGLQVVAANAPRRYVSRVSRNGRASLQDLSSRARENLPPLPYGQPSEAYRDQWIRTMGEMMEQAGMKCGVPVPDSVAPAPMGSHSAMGQMMDSQVLWDATMAWWVSNFLQAHPGALVLHMVGSFHVARGTGIPEHLQAYRPGARAMIVVLRPVDDVDSFEPAPDGQWGDFVIQTDVSRTLEAIECRSFLAEHGPQNQPSRSP